VVEEVRSAFGDEAGFVAPEEADVATDSQAAAEVLEFDVVAAQADFNS
jgi:hypothetical protein